MNFRNVNSATLTVTLGQSDPINHLAGVIPFVSYYTKCTSTILLNTPWSTSINRVILLPFPNGGSSRRSYTKYETGDHTSRQTAQGIENMKPEILHELCRRPYTKSAGDLVGDLKSSRRSYRKSEAGNPAGHLKPETRAAMTESLKISRFIHEPSQSSRVRNGTRYGRVG